MTNLTFRYLAISLVIGGFLWAAGPADAARQDRYIDRLAANAAAAGAHGNCLELRSVELCGYRVRLVRRAELLDGTVEACGYGRVCAFTIEGRSRAGVAFFCTGTLRIGRRRIWPDQAFDCYGDDDPTWSEYDDGVIIRTPAGA